MSASSASSAVLPEVVALTDRLSNAALAAILCWLCDGRPETLLPQRQAAHARRVINRARAADPALFDATPIALIKADAEEG